MLLEQLNKDSLDARKSKDTLKANLLVTLISEAKMIGKNAGNREPNEQEVTDVIKKFLKGINDTISILEKESRDCSKEKMEKEILDSYLPKQMSEADLEKAVNEIVETLPEKSLKMMGKVMAALKEKYPNQYDGKIASSVVKNILS